MAELSITDLSEDIRAAIAQLKERPEIESVGVVTRVGDGKLVPCCLAPTPK